MNAKIDERFLWCTKYSVKVLFIVIGNIKIRYSSGFEAMFIRNIFQGRKKLFTSKISHSVLHSIDFYYSFFISTSGHSYTISTVFSSINVHTYQSSDRYLQITHFFFHSQYI